jgi:hypothetical protein
MQSKHANTNTGIVAGPAIENWTLGNAWKLTLTKLH